ncbi:MAG: protein translocase subunit SecD [Dehalococcoidia bacterium]|nr:protein translocase subunit SecD [Dehalococcoidia bacterium]MDW8009856.1 protein translocase subunit SecD [Chloroflexota bacterium]
MRRPTDLLLLLFVLGLTAFAVVVVWPGDPNRYLPDFIPWPRGQGLKIGDFDRQAMRLGLDLKGGTYVLLEADVTALAPGTDIDQAMEGVKQVIEQRVNAFGVAETEIQREGRYRLSAQLPGISPEEARDLIGRTARLEFLEPQLDANGNYLCRASDGSQFTAAPGLAPSFDRNLGRILCLGDQGQAGDLLLQPAMCRQDCPPDVRGIPLTGAELESNSRVETNPQGTGVVVTLNFKSRGATILQDVSRRLVGKPLAIALDGQIIAAPVVRQELSGSAVIEGLSLNDAKRLAVQLNSGALPVPMRVVQETQVDATLGDTTVRHSIQAGILGIMGVMAFMVLVYRLPGVVAALALVTYASVLLLIFKLWPVTLTLAGIAAFVLSVGMAVDANILVFERLREELRAGRSLASAVEAGFDRAWTSIRDSNISTLITCGILWWFGDQFNASLVKGFALTLAIGVLVSMFSAITVTRTYLRALVGTPLARNLWLFGAERPRPAAGTERRPFVIPFVERRWLYFAISALVLVPGLISLMVPPALKPGIEFTSGTTFTIRFQDPPDPEAVRALLAELGHPQARVQVADNGDYILRLGEMRGAINVPPVGPPPPSERDTIEEALRQRFGDFQVRNFDTVSEIVSRSIGRNAAIAVGVAAAAILLYISFAFRHLPRPYRYGIAAVVALMHDVLFVIGAFSIFGKVFGMEVNTMFITGMLTAAGFSVHDTIVVFDRIRENMARYPGEPFADIVNTSLTETLVRSLNTSLTLIITVVAMLLLAGTAVQTLLLVMLLGTVTGTYSSIFVASQVLVSWEEGDFARLFRRLFPRRPVPVEA